jgi:endonuclease/exonuclease/phosphatase (EEP) superfamily protein YafD
MSAMTDAAEADAAMSEAQSPRRSGSPIAGLFGGLIVLGVSLALVGAAICHFLQPDDWAAVTAVPLWCWVLACVILSMLGTPFASRRVRAVNDLVIVVVLVMGVEQTYSLSRWAWRSAVGSPEVAATERLCVVTVNCSGGSRQAAADAAAHDPDVVLLQESPSEDQLQSLAVELFGEQSSVAWARDCSIIARGELSEVERQSHHTQALLTLPDGRQVVLFSLRLSPPIVRYDLWNNSCWIEHTDQRVVHRQEAGAIAAALAAVPTDRPIMVGGDCNVPAGDGALESWQPEVRDAFAVAGIGWGCTVLNRIPVHRFDQLWCGQSVEPVSIFAAKSRFSDHRLVVGEFRLPALPAAGP